MTDDLPLPAPDVMFLPMAVGSPEGFTEVDPGLLARRLPDFVHQILNQAQAGPTGMLEVQTPPEDGPAEWVTMDEPPGAEEAFELVPDGDDVRVVVAGELAPAPDGVRVEFIAYRREDLVDGLHNRLVGVMPYADPVPALLAMARRLARVLELPWHEPPKGLLTRDGRAFLKFLEGLDSAMLLSGDLAIEAPAQRELLMRPFAEALALDPGFGFALRVAHSTMAMALEGARLDKDHCQRFLDECFSVQPWDGEGCVAVAEHLTELGDDRRALQWLQHAAHLDPPPARGLESLGILFANQGDTVRARALWLRGIDLDGNPDFFAHLARLYFAEGRELDAWDMVLRGLRRVQERAGRAGEWDEHERGGGVLLEYLAEHLEERRSLPDVAEALLDLCGLLLADDRVCLGLCLKAVGEKDHARAELTAALAGDELDLELRDRAVHALLQLDVRDFEKRLTRASEAALRGRNPRPALVDLAEFLAQQPEFWPAVYLTAVACRRLGQEEKALDLLAEALALSPGQPEVLREMAVIFDLRGNPKRALELIEEALGQRPGDARMVALKTTFLLHLGREAEAREFLAGAVVQGGEQGELQRLRRRLGL